MTLFVTVSGALNLQHLKMTDHNQR